VVVASRFLLAPEAGAKPVEVASPVTDTELGWMVREVAPLVEQVAGRPFLEIDDRQERLNDGGTMLQRKTPLARGENSCRTAERP